MDASDCTSFARPNGARAQTDRIAGGARDRVGLADAEETRGDSCGCWTRCSTAGASLRAATGLPLCGAKAAAWQKAQVASSWIGRGSDSRGELMKTAVEAEEAVLELEADAALPSAR